VERDHRAHQEHLVLQEQVELLVHQEPLVHLAHQEQVELLVHQEQVEPLVHQVLQVLQEVQEVQERLALQEHPVHRVRLELQVLDLIQYLHL
jgi:hypothetical protein